MHTLIYPYNLIISIAQICFYILLSNANPVTYCLLTDNRHNDSEFEVRRERSVNLYGVHSCKMDLISIYFVITHSSKFRVYDIIKS